ncbi:MAG: hypothetical protein K8R06_02340, partial [Methanosarcinales archaeon]|nr:hypothetical protein [Methanosarcinales archaeon]
WVKQQEQKQEHLEPKRKMWLLKSKIQTSLNPLARLQNKSYSFKEPSGTKQWGGLYDQGL